MRFVGLLVDFSAKADAFRRAVSDRCSDLPFQSTRLRSDGLGFRSGTSRCPARAHATARTVGFKAEWSSCEPSDLDRMHWNSKLALTAAWVAAGTAIYLVLPQSLPFLLPLAAAAPLLWSQREGLVRRLCARSLAGSPPGGRVSLPPDQCHMVIGVDFCLRMHRDLLCSRHHRAHRRHHGTATRARALACDGCRLLRRLCHLCLPGERRGRLRQSTPSVCLRRGPQLVPDLADAVVEAGVIRSLPDFFLNKHITALTFLIWPALLVATRLGASARVRAQLSVACLMPAAVAIFASAHDTSKVALVGGAIVFSVPHAGASAGRTGPGRCLDDCLSGSGASSLGCLRPWTATRSLVAESARHRIVIWSATSTQITEAPILGHGMGSARDLGRKRRSARRSRPARRFG